jgi:hypothetical protein
MKTVTSISGGKSSAYISANYPSDYLVFSLVRTSDKSCVFPDKYVRKMVEDKIQNEFIGTLEDDKIIYTMLDLEQYLGQKIDWVTGMTFDDVVDGKSGAGMLPNSMHRFCTSEMKIRPIFRWWRKTFDNPVNMKIGFKASEKKRADNMNSKLNADGLTEFKDTNSKHPDGRNKWETIAWRKLSFPLIDDFIYNEDVIKFWKDKPVRFARYNNCIGCFHQKIPKLKAQSKYHPKKFEWFAKQEGGKKGFWRKDCSYKKINKLNFTGDLFKGSNGCDSGFCGF